MRNPERLAGLFFGAALLAAFAGCSKDKSYALVTVLADSGSFTNVTQLRVLVENDPFEEILFYPKTARAAAEALEFDTTKAISFSVSFPESHTGTLRVGVAPLDTTGATIGYGMAVAAIDTGEVVKVTVKVVPGATPPPLKADGGVGDGGERTDAAAACEPAAPAGVCGTGKTCYVSCRPPPDNSSVGMCFMAGTKPAGQSCAGNEECLPGSQCFKFACSVGGQTVRTCLKFCTDDGQCGAGRCTGSVPCGPQPTGHRTCSQACDPVGATSGCADGLACFLFSGETPDCDCRNPATQIGVDGSSCTTRADCQPGFLCVTTRGTNMMIEMRCRALCRLNGAATCPMGATCTKLTQPDYSVFGACLTP
jgi:hypothetical protein